MGSDGGVEEQIADLRDRLDALDHRLTQQQDEYELRLEQLERSSARPASKPLAMPPPPPIGAIPLPGPGGPPAFQDKAKPSPAAGSMNPDWEVLIRWAGIVLLALAAIFLVSTSISRGWIGPNLQLAAATIGGLGLLGGSVHFAPRLRAWAITLGSGGAVVLPVCAAAAHEWLDLVSEEAALVLVVVAIAVSLGVGVIAGLDKVSIVALVAGMVVPAGFGFFHVEPITLVAWWAAATAVTASVVGWVRRSTLLRVAGDVAAGALLLAPAGISVEREIDVLAQGVGPLILITAVMWLGPAVAERIGTDHLTSFDHWTVAVAPCFAWLTVVALRSRGEESSWFDAGLIGLAMAGGFLIVLITSSPLLPKFVTLAHFLGASALLTVSIVAMADGPVLVAALASQAVFTFILGRYFDDGVSQVAGGLLGVAATLLTGVGILEGIANEGADLGEALAHLLVVVLVAASAVVFYADNERELAKASAIVAWVGTLGWLASVLINVPQGQAAISIAWAILAGGAIVMGVVRRAATVRTTGLVTLTVVVAKLLTVDLGEVDVFWRAGVFFLVGSGLLRLAYLLPRYETDGGDASTERTR